MPENKQVRILLNVLFAVLAVTGIWLGLTILLPWLLPFLVALTLAAVLERPVVLLANQMHFPRWAAAALCTFLLVLILSAGLGLLLWRVGYEVALLLGRLPTMLSGLPTLASQMEDWAYRFIIAAPVQFQDFLRDTLSGIVAQGITLPNRFYDWLAGLVTYGVSVFPEVGLSLFTTTLATYFTSAQRPVLLAFLRRQIPRSWRPYLRELRRQLGGTLGRWIKAQGLLMVLTFTQLTIGFLLLRIDLALLLAALVALVDLLPVFGTGTVLLPWAAITLLGGDWKLAAGLAILYFVVSFVRNLMEPKLVGDRLGLPPLAALAAMYVGFQAFGVWGMILSPLATIFIKQLHDCGLVQLWRD